MLYHSSVEDLDSVKKKIVKERVVPDAVNYWQDIFKVRTIRSTTGRISSRIGL